MSIVGYLRFRMYFEIGFWVALLLLIFALDTVLILMDLIRFQQVVPIWEPIVWMASSLLVFGSLLPVLIRFDKRFPIALNNGWSNIAAHFVFSLAFSVVHISAMIGLRKLAYAWVGSYYDFGVLWLEFIYECLKNMRTYVAVLAVICSIGQRMVFQLKAMIYPSGC
jgi:hypothetical protein